MQSTIQLCSLCEAHSQWQLSISVAISASVVDDIAKIPHMSEMSNENIENGKYGTGASGEGVMPGRCSAGEQGGPGRHPATASRTRITWTKELNKLAMKCYLMSEPSKRGFRKRMLNVWRDIGVFEIDEQKLAGQVLAIKNNGWLSNLEIEEIKREIEHVQQEEDCVGEPANILEDQNRIQRDDDVEIDHGRNEDEQRQMNYNLLIERMQQEGQDEEKMTIVKLLISELETKEPQKPPNLRGINRRKVKECTDKVNQVLHYFQTESLRELNNLLKAAANVVANLVGFKRKVTKDKQKEPWWKRRLKWQIKDIRRDISRLEYIKAEKTRRYELQETLERKYHIKRKGITAVIEELKQRVLAKTAKIKRYESRVDQFNQNRLFQNNQKKLFEKIEGIERMSDVTPDADETKKFWSGIWGKDVLHNEGAEWLQGVEKEVERVVKQQEVLINVDMVTKQLKHIPNWKAPGPDGLQGYWLKHLTSVRHVLAALLQSTLQNDVPSWLVTGSTTLIMKDKDKGAEVSNFRPITCLPLMWKLFTGLLSQEIYQHLEQQNLLPDAQKGCRKTSRGTKDQLLIDKMIIRNSKRRQTGLAMGWIDYKKAYDMVPHSWIIKCLRMFKVADNIIDIISCSMTHWNTILTSNNVTLGNVNIRRGIFQGDSLSPLLFVVCLIPLSMILAKVKAGYDLGKGKASVNHLLFMDDLKLYGKNEKQLDLLVNTVRIFSEDIKMEFGISKCAVLVMKRGKYDKSPGIVLPDGAKIEEVDMDKGYKYLGILEAEEIREKSMKSNIQKEYFRRVRKILKSKLNGTNCIKAINSRAVSLVRYSAGILKWTKEDVQNMDRKTRKLLTIYRAFHPKGDVDRLYFERKKGGRGLIGVEDCVNIEVESLRQYVQQSDEKLLKEVNDESMLEKGKTKNDIREEKLENYKQKTLHGKFYTNTQEGRDDCTWTWLCKGDLKKETEGMLMAAQDQALRTRYIRKIIDKEDICSKCRMCNEREETIAHILSECKMLAQKQYKLWRHDRVARIIHWDLCRKWNIEHAEKWYDHEPPYVVENDEVKLLWDMKIQTDIKIEHSKPDIVVFEKKSRKCLLIDVACPFDTRVAEKEREKLDRYDDLKREIKRLWSCKSVAIVPIIIGALGTIHENFNSRLKMLDLAVGVNILQKACLLGSAKILRKVLDT